MELPKLPNNLSTDDLIQILEEKSSVSLQPSTSRDVLSFLSHFNIKPGNNLIKKSIIYKLYSAWSPSPLNSREFHSRVGKFLVSHQIGKDHLYFLNLDSLELSKKTLDLIKKSERDRTKNGNFRRHFEAYLDTYQIKPGHVWLESYILYYLYDKWIYKTRRKYRLSNNSFLKFCKLYFEHKRKSSSQVLWFAVDEAVLLSITQEEIEQLRIGRKREKKENPKGKRKVSRPKTRT